MKKEFGGQNEAEISEIEELNRLEELDLFDPVKSYVESLPKIKFHSYEEDKTLAARVAEGDQEARDEMFFSVARMVVNEAKKRSDSADEIMDLIDEGNFTLITRGIDLYDPKKGTKFITYATERVRHVMNKSAQKSHRPFSVSATDAAKASTLDKRIHTFVKSEGYEPTAKEIQQISGMTPAEVAYFTGIIRSKKVYLSRPVGQDGDEVLEDFIESGASEEEFRIRQEAAETLDRINKEIENIAEIDRQNEAKGNPTKFAYILRMRLGIQADGTITRPLVNRELAQTLGVSPERIKQLEVVAIRKVKDHKVNRMLAHLLLRTRNS